MSIQINVTKKSIKPTHNSVQMFHFCRKRRKLADLCGRNILSYQILLIWIFSLGKE